MADAWWGIFFICAILMFSLAGAGTILKISEARKECNLNSDCSSANYCGSDFKCHPFPQIENTVVKTDWTVPSAIVGLSIVIAAMILRKRSEKREFY